MRSLFGNLKLLLLRGIEGMGNGEWGMGNGKWGMGSGEWGMGSGEESFEFLRINNQ